MKAKNVKVGTKVADKGTGDIGIVTAIEDPELEDLALDWQTGEDAGANLSICASNIKQVDKPVEPLPMTGKFQSSYIKAGVEYKFSGRGSVEFNVLCQTFRKTDIKELIKFLKKVEKQVKDIPANI